ncbi:MAG: hypothetical protein DRR03_11110 [Gammaproteobacteria bacterium]|nr:MAG: hypothetical protein DRR03_11110 [Gammaproteobacteria bacterium]
MRSTTRHLLASFLSLLLAALPMTANAAIYKWVDEEGNTHFGSAIPPEYAKQDTQKERLNERGQTIEIVQEKEKTPEQLAEEKRLREEKAARQKELDRKRQHDRLLLSTYDSVDGLELARDGKIQALEGQITVASGQIREREALLKRQRSNAADLERSGGKIGKKLLDHIAATENQIARNEARIEVLRADQERIRATYEADITRYRELKGLPPEKAAKQ